MITAVARGAVKYVAMFHFGRNKVVFVFFFFRSVTCGDNKLSYATFRRSYFGGFLNLFLHVST